ncbi:hypothetical protein STEG23_003051, partial [Scotinomys teguina]
IPREGTPTQLSFIECYSELVLLKPSSGYVSISAVPTLDFPGTGVIGICELPDMEDLGSILSPPMSGLPPSITVTPGDLLPSSYFCSLPRCNQKILSYECDMFEYTVSISMSGWLFQLSLEVLPPLMFPMTVTPLGWDQDCSLKIREPEVPAPWFLDPGGWSKTAAVSLYFIFPGICTLFLVE